MKMTILSIIMRIIRITITMDSVIDVINEIKYSCCGLDNLPVALQSSSLDINHELKCIF